MKRAGFFLGWIAAPVLFAQTDIRVSDVTAQQVILEYSTSNAEPCKLSLTSGAVLAETPWDLSEEEFPGASFDLLRGNTIEFNGRRKVELGLRTVQKGRSGKLRSRSLQANTPYTLTIACVGQSATTTFQTANIPVGNMAPDPPAVDPDGFGNAAWPSIDWADRNAVYIDPKTGFALRRAGFGQVPFQNADTQFFTYFDSAGSWESASNILSGKNTALASTSGSTPIFVSLNPAVPGPGSSSFAGYTVTDLRVQFIGNGGGQAKKLNVCLTADSGQTCLSAIQEVTLPAVTGAVSFPANNFPSAPFLSWGLTKWPEHNLVIPFVSNVKPLGDFPPYGTGFVSQSEVPSATGLFPTNLPPGSKVLVKGSSCPNQLCTVSLVPNALSIIVSEDTGALGATTITAANFGVKVWKPQEVAGPVNLTLAYDIVYEGTPSFLIEDGASDQCSHNTIEITEDARGTPVPPTPAYLCILETRSNDGHSLHLFIPDTGELRQVGLVTTGYSGDNGDQFHNASIPRMPYGPWDTANGRTLYGLAFNGLGRYTVAKWVYRGRGKAYSPGPVIKDGLYSREAAPSDSTIPCATSEFLWTNLCVSMVTKTSQSHDLVTMLKASNPAADAGMFGFLPRPIAVIGSQMAIFWQRQQDGLTAFTYIDLTTGAQTKYADTLGTNQGFRWGGVHTAGAWVAGSRHMVAVNPLGSRGNAGPGAGPYSSPVTAVWLPGSSQEWSADTTLPARYSYTCPANTFGVTGTNCVRVRIGGMPCSAAADELESRFWPCPWNARYSMPTPLAAGDLVGNIRYQGNGANSELMRVLSLTQNSPTEIEVWLQRYVSELSTGSTSFSNGWSLTPYPTESSYWWLDSQGTQSMYADDPGIGSHFDVVPAPAGYSVSGTLSAKYNVPAEASGFAQFMSPLQSFGVWAQLQPPVGGGNYPWPGIGNVEFYPSCRQTKAPVGERVWCADWRAYQGGGFTGGNAGTYQTGATFYTLVPGTHAVYRFSLTDQGNHPKVLPIENWGGRFLYKEHSGPNAMLTDADARTFCRAYKAGECVADSSPGEIYFVSNSAISTQPYCFTNHLEAEIPCFFQANPLGTWAVQHDISTPDQTGYHFRRLTMGFSAPGRLPTATNWRPTPDGKWGFFPSSWMDGFGPVLWIGKLPPWPGYDAYRRDDFVNMEVSLSPGDPWAEIRFGYEEFGTPRDMAGERFFCSSRRETCVTNSAAQQNDPASRYNWMETDGHAPTSCGNGCKISVPSISGRILWLRVYRSADGSTWNPEGDILRTAVP